MKGAELGVVVVVEAEVDVARFPSIASHACESAGAHRNWHLRLDVSHFRVQVPGSRGSRGYKGKPRKKCQTRIMTDYDTATVLQK